MANQTYTLVVTGNCAGQFVQNVFHYRMDDDSFADRLSAAKGVVDGWIGDTKQDYFLAWHPEGYILKSIKCRRATNGGGPEWIDTSLDGSPGARSGDLQAASVGPCIIWNTDGGPRRIGKTFVSGCSISDVAGGELSATAVSDIQSAAQDFSAPFVAVGGSTPGVTFCIPRANDLTTRSLVLAAQVSKNLGKQRRRQLPV